MALRRDAAERLLRWQLDGHGAEVGEAMASHPDEPLERIVEYLEREHPQWTAEKPPETAAPSGDMRDILFGEETPKLGDLAKIFAQMRPAMPAGQSQDIARRFLEAQSRPDRQTIGAIRRTLGELSLEVDFRRELVRSGGAAIPRTVLLFRSDGRVLARYGDLESLDREGLGLIVRRSLASDRRGAYAGSLRDGRVLVVRGEWIVAAVVFPSAPGREAVTKLGKAVETLEAAVSEGEISEATGRRLAQAVAWIVARPSL